MIDPPNGNPIKKLMDKNARLWFAIKELMVDKPVIVEMHFYHDDNWITQKVYYNLADIPDPNDDGIIFSEGEIYKVTDLDIVDFDDETVIIEAEVVPWRV